MVNQAGMYHLNNVIFKVQESKQSPGRFYAKELRPINGIRLNLETNPRIVQHEFVYAQGAVYALSAANRMSLEDAKAFGIRYGVCCVCGITLKDAISVAQGIGPVCGGRV